MARCDLGSLGFRAYTSGIQALSDASICGQVSYLV